MRLGLERNHRLYLPFFEEVGAGGVGGRELLHFRALHEGHIIFIGRHEAIGVLLRRLFYHLEEAGVHFLAVDDERTVENLVATVLGVNLREAEDLAVRQGAAQTRCQPLEIDYLLVA